MPSPAHAATLSSSPDLCPQRLPKRHATAPSAVAAHEAKNTAFHPHRVLRAPKPMLDRALPTYVTALRMPVTVAVCPWRLKRNGNRLSSIVLTLVKQVVLNSNTANVIPRLSLPQNSHRSKPAPHTPKKRHAVDASFRKRRTFTALPMYTPLRFTSGSSIVSETEKAVSRLNFSCRKDGTHVMMPSFKRPWIHAARQTGASVSTSCCVLFFSGRVLRTFP